MAVLTSTGINFSDGTSLNSKYGIVPQNAVSVFFQSSAPTNWSKLTTHNNKTLRVVADSGGVDGGTTAFTSVFPNSTIPFSLSGTVSGVTIGNHTLSAAQLPSHSHANGGAIGLTAGAGDVAAGAGWTRTSPGTSGNSPNGGSHTHPFSGSASFSTSLDLRVQYIDVILCQFS